MRSNSKAREHVGHLLHSRPDEWKTLFCADRSTEADLVFFLRENNEMPPSIDREKMFIDLSPVKRCLCWLSTLVIRLHLAQSDQNTNTPLSFGGIPSHPPSLRLSPSVYTNPQSLQIRLYFLPPQFNLTVFCIAKCVHVCACAAERKSCAFAYM